MYNFQVLDEVVGVSGKISKDKVQMVYLVLGVI